MKPKSNKRKKNPVAKFMNLLNRVTVLTNKKVYKRKDKHKKADE